MKNKLLLFEEYVKSVKGSEFLRDKTKTKDTKSKDGVEEFKVNDIIKLYDHKNYDNNIKYKIIKIEKHPASQFEDKILTVKSLKDGKEFEVMSYKAERVDEANQQRNAAAKLAIEFAEWLHYNSKVYPDGWTYKGDHYTTNEIFDIWNEM